MDKSSSTDVRGGVVGSNISILFSFGWIVAELGFGLGLSETGSLLTIDLRLDVFGRTPPFGVSNDSVRSDFTSSVWAVRALKACTH